MHEGFTGTECRHADRPVARLKETEVDALAAKKSLILGHVQRAFPLACRTGGCEHFDERRRRMRNARLKNQR
jgi:hypothetical protein